MIAGALVLQPQVIIADEPVSSLDASVRGEILALLLALRESLGLSLLVVTHDLGVAWNIADRIAVMYLGRIVERGLYRGSAARRPSTLTRARCCQWCPRSTTSTPSSSPVSLRPDSDPGRVPFPSPLPRTARRFGAAVEADCRGKDLPVLDGSGGHEAACWLANLNPVQQA